MKTAFFYHCRLSGGRNVDTGASIDRRIGDSVFDHQMQLAQDSGLDRESDIFSIHVNGEYSNFKLKLGLNTKISLNGVHAESLLPTISAMQKWLPGHEDWAVGFAHMKGVTHPNNLMVQKWANCLNHHTITMWRQNVADLESGQYDACGCHWTHNSPNDTNADRWGSNSYFGGCFWWATAKFLLTLPEIPDKPTDRHSWFLPELWLGNGHPRVKDYHPGPVTNH